MASKDYNVLTLKEAIQLYWITSQPIGNRLGVLPKGTPVRITGKMNGWEIESLGCECCGLKMRISKVSHSCLIQVNSRPDK